MATETLESNAKKAPFHLSPTTLFFAHHPHPVCLSVHDPHVFSSSFKSSSVSDLTDKREAVFI